MACVRLLNAAVLNLFTGAKSRHTILLESHTKKIMEGLLRAAQKVLGSCMWLSEQWLRNTGVMEDIVQCSFVKM